MQKSDLRLISLVHFLAWGGVLGAVCVAPVDSAEIVITRLTTGLYDRFPEELVSYLGVFAEKKHQFEEIDLAVVTISSGQNEPLIENDASTTLAMKEAAKIGGTGVYFVSSAHSETAGVDSQTFRIVRRPFHLRLLAIFAQNKK